MTEKKAAETSYTEKVWQTVGIVAFVAILILIARVAFSVMLLSLAGCLIAVYFHGLGDLIQRKTKWKRIICMAIAITASFLVLAVLLWFMGSKIQAQIAVLSDSLPHTVSVAKAQLAETALGRKVLEASGSDNSEKLLATAQQFFSSSFGVLGDLYIILFLGIFLRQALHCIKTGSSCLCPGLQKSWLKRSLTVRV